MTAYLMQCKQCKVPRFRVPLQVLLQLLACPPGGISRSELKAVLLAGPLVGRAAETDARVPAADIELEGIINGLSPWLVSSRYHRCDSLLRLEHTVVRRCVRRRYDPLWDPGTSSDESEGGNAAKRPSLLSAIEEDRHGYAWVQARVWTVGTDNLQVGGNSYKHVLQT